MLDRVARLLATDYDVVADVSDGVAAVNAALALQPDLLVLDISMPGLTGLEAAANLAEQPDDRRSSFSRSTTNRNSSIPREKSARWGTCSNATS